MDHRIGERQRWAWLAGGLSAAMAACGCGISWPWVLAGGLLVSLYYIYLDVRLGADGLSAVMPKWLRGLTWCWTVILLAWTANLSDRAFPMVNGFPTLSLTMLALAAWGSWKGTAACARCAGVLCLFLIGLYSIIVGFSLPDVQLTNLKPMGAWQDAVKIIGLFLLPSAVWYGPCTRSRKKPVWSMGALLPAGAALLSAVTAGVLTPILAAAWPVPLYTLAQSVSLFGVVERIEPLLSAAMVMGAFCLTSAMACACSNLIKDKGWLACIAAAVLLSPAGQLDLLTIAIGGIAIWMLAPLAALSLR